MGKKGWGGGETHLHEKFKVHWHYTWSASHAVSKSIEFVPMIKGARSFDDAHSIKDLTRSNSLLGFNEPERADQGNVSVTDALNLWPKLEAIANAHKLRIGSPACSSDTGGVNWFEAFMKGAKQRKLKIDFVALHWYRSRDAGAFEKYVTGMARQHRLPVWVTEFNGWNGTETENRAFLRKALSFLERSRDVERYAYFNPRSDKPHALLQADGTLTRMGEIYRDA